MGGDANTIGSPLQYEIFTFVHSVFLPLLKILFVWLEWLKSLKDPLEEDSPMVAGKITHIFFTYSDFIFFLYLPILKISYV